MNKAVKYGAVLIGIYLLVAYSSGSGTVITQGLSGTGNLVAKLQGR